MIRVLTLSTLFPDAIRPVFGPFVERQTLGLATHPDVDVRVVAPIGVPPWPVSRHARYREFDRVPVQENWKGLTVYRPRFWHLPGTQGRFDAPFEARAVLPLLKKIRQEFAFDVIDAEFFFPDGPAAIALGRALNCPVSIKARGADIHHWGRQGPTAAQVLKAGQGAAGLLTVSSALKADMVALGMPEGRIRVHYTGVDLDRFQPQPQQELKRELGVSGPLVVSVGALIERKGHDIVIKALRELPDATLVIIGKGEDGQKLAALAATGGLSARVKFLGAQPAHEIARWLAAADVMALASASEGLANAWVEALACGTPIVITDVGGARELLTGQTGGRLVEREPQSFARAIKDLIAAPPPRDEQRQIAARFTWEANRDALHQHFSEILNR